MVVDEWRGDRGHDFVCVSSSPRGAEMIVRGNARHIFSSNTCQPTLRAGTISNYSSLTLVHSCTFAQIRKIYVNVP